MNGISIAPGKKIAMILTEKINGQEAKKLACISISYPI